MNSNKEFDELARQKLAERSFPFEEGHWLAAQQALQAEKGSSKRGFWLLGALALLLAGGAAWWWMLDDAVLAHGGITAVEVEPNNERIEAEDISTALQYSAATAPKTAEEALPTRLSEQTGIASLERAEKIQSQPAAEQAGTPVQNVGTTIGSAQHGIRKARPMRSAMASQGLVQSTDPPASPKADELAVAAVVRETQQHTAVSNAPSGSHEGSTLLTLEEPSSKAIEMAMEPTAWNEEPAGEEPKGIAIAEQPTVQTVDAVHERENTSTEILVPEAASANASNTELPRDSADAALPEPLQLPLVAQHSPWEVGVLGGIFSTTSSFQGANSADWNDAVTRQRGASVGAELMRMGSNFGVGFGVHYGTYAERIAVGEVNNTQIDIDRFWYLRPVDTAIFVITDTLFQGGSPYYTGESVNTTINVLTQGFDTTTTITQRRTARELYNRVSYVEVPLLLDVHLVQGRWSLGLRGGPTLGLLAGRRGSLPNGSNDGYTEFSDQAFRELMVGYTARAYIRYRWNAAWSVGLEPAIRGQLMNSLADGPLERRSSAFGGMISLSYRLR